MYHRLKIGQCEQNEYGTGFITNRYVNNLIIVREDIPNIPPSLIDVTSVFNPGAVKFDDQYVLMLGVQNRGREIFTLMAYSDDGFIVKEQELK